MPMIYKAANPKITEFKPNESENAPTAPDEITPLNERYTASAMPWALEVSMVLVWKKDQIFSKVARKFIEGLNNRDRAGQYLEQS
jgi:hypothetical protein